MEYDMSMTYGENLALVYEQSYTDPSVIKRGGYTAARDVTNVRDPRTNQLSAMSKTDSGYSKAIRVDAPTVSEVLSKAREYFFTPEGMTAQLVLSILGSELGLPVVFTVLDIAILINDFTIMISNWEPKESNSEENWFSHHWENNKGFQLVIEDLILLLTGGILKLVGMGAKAAYRAVLKKLGRGIKEAAIEAEKIIVKKESMIKRLPKTISEWAQSKVNNLKNGINLLKNPTAAVKSVANTKKVAAAAALGTANYAFTSWLDKKHKAAESINSGNLAQLSDQDYMHFIVMDNPNLFKVEIQGNRNQGDYWDYKRELDGKFYAKNTKGDNKWVLATGKPLENIKQKFEYEVYPDYKFKSFKVNSTGRGFNIDGKNYDLIVPLKNNEYKLTPKKWEL